MENRTSNCRWFIFDDDELDGFVSCCFQSHTKNWPLEVIALQRAFNALYQSTNQAISAHRGPAVSHLTPTPPARVRAPPTKMFFYFNLGPDYAENSRHTHHHYLLLILSSADTLGSISSSGSIFWQTTAIFPRASSLEPKGRGYEVASGYCF